MADNFMKNNAGELIQLGGTLLSAYGANKNAQQTRADNLRNAQLDAQLAAAGQRGSTNANLYNQQADTRQTFGKNAMEDATAPQDFMAKQAQRAVAQSIFKGLPGAYNQPASSISPDVYSRMDALLSKGAETNVLRNLQSGMSQRNPLGAAIDPVAYGMSQELGSEFGDTQSDARRNWFDTENQYRAGELDNLNTTETSLAEYLKQLQAEQAAAGGSSSGSSGSKGGNALKGAATGAATGAAVGSVVPVIGTGIGAAVGGLVGGIKGWMR